MHIYIGVVVHIYSIGPLWSLPKVAAAANGSAASKPGIQGSKGKSMRQLLSRQVMMQKQNHCAMTCIGLPLHTVGCTMMPVGELALQ